MRLRSFARVCGLIGLALAADAQAQWQYDARVFALLPPWCKYTPLYAPIVPGGQNQAEIRRWNNIMGPGNFRHMHHYCRGLEHTTRALYFERTKAGRDRELRHSVMEFDYVIERVHPAFAMLPEILSKKGENLMRLGLDEAGLRALHRAIELQGDYWPAHAALSDYYKAAGDLNRAREWVEQGLVSAPQAKPLQRRLEELDEIRPKKD